MWQARCQQAWVRYMARGGWRSVGWPRQVPVDPPCLIFSYLPKFELTRSPSLKSSRTASRMARAWCERELSTLVHNLNQLRVPKEGWSFLQYVSLESWQVFTFLVLLTIWNLPDAREVPGQGALCGFSP